MRSALIAGPVRLARRARTDASPARLWSLLGDPKTWPDLLAYPAPMAEVRRVKTIGSAAPAPGGRVQVLHADKAWTVYELVAWAPEKRIELVPVEEGHGEGEGRKPAVARRERLLIIPQGDGAEVEWSVRFAPGIVQRVFAAVALDRTGWADALEARIRALVGAEAEIETEA